MAKFSIPMYRSRLLLTGVQDFMGKSEYVQSSDIQRTEANFRRKTPKTSTSASAVLKLKTPTFPGQTPIFQLTPTFSRDGFYNSCFQNPSENYGVTVERS